MFFNKQNIYSTGALKLFFFPEKIKKWIRGESFAPIALEIQPSERCSHNCPDCQAQYPMSLVDAKRARRSGSFLDFSLLDSVWKNPPNGIILSGNTGEPLMHPDAVALVRKIKSLNIPIALVTNGDKIRVELVDLLLRACRGIRISLDAYDEKSYEETHGVGKSFWGRTRSNIRMLIEARKGLKVSPRDCLIGVGYLTNEKTKKGMLRATELAAALKVDYIQFRPFHYQACSIQEELRQCKEVEKREEIKVLASYQKYDLVDCQGHDYVSCEGAFFFTVIDARGDVYICCHHVGREEAKIGTLKESTWSEVNDYALKSRSVKEFPSKTCIPLCRLNAQNIVLDRIKKSRKIPKTSLSPNIELHAMFL